MDFAEAIRSRRAIRKFDRREVPPEILEKVFELSKWVPVIEIFHNWSYLVLTGRKRDEAVNIISKNTIHLRDILEQVDEDSRRKALEFYPDLGGAPVIIVQSIPVISQGWEKKNLVLISGIALSVLMNSLHYYGIGACGVTISPLVEKNLVEEFELVDREILAALAVGFPAEVPPAPRKSEEKITYLD